MGGMDFCCVVGCSNRRSVAKMPYHRIPKKPEGRRKSWIKATGRQCHGKNKFIVTLYTRVCGAHFVNGVKSDNLHSVDYIPTQKLPATITTPGQPTQPRLTATSTKARAYREAVETGIKAKPIRYSARRKLVINELDINDVQHGVQIMTENMLQSEPKFPDISSANITQFPIHQEDHLYAKAGFPNVSTDPPMQSVSIQTNKDELSCCLFTAIPVQDNSTQMPESRPSHKCVQIDSFETEVGHNLTEIKIKNQQKMINTLKEKVSTLQNDCYEVKKKVFSAKNILLSSKKVQFYTGLPNNETFHALFEYVKPKAQRLVYWKGKQTKTGKRKGDQKMSLLDQFFATLVRLRLGLAIKDIAERFSVSVGYMSSVFNTWVRFLRLELEALFPYPSADQVKQNLPESFSKFPNTRLIIDCTEIYVQKPTALKAQRQTWSNYKHRNTHKILVGITPDGTVAYVSPLYGGSASDKFIVKHCGLLHHIQSGDCILADRGFEISSELSKHGADLNIPPFKNGNHQLTPQQVEKTRRIAEVRIHVERAIQRIKTFNILNGTSPASLHMVAEDVFKTCSYLTNFQSPIIKI